MERIEISANFNTKNKEPEINKRDLQFDFQKHPDGPKHPDFV